MNAKRAINAVVAAIIGIVGFILLVGGLLAAGAGIVWLLVYHTTIFLILCGVGVVISTAYALYRDRAWDGRVFPKGKDDDSFPPGAAIA